MSPSNDTRLAAIDVEPAAPSCEVERTRRLYRRVAPFYGAFRKLWSSLTRPIENDLDRLFRERVGPSARVLELAPGTGINVDRVLRCAPDFGSYLGIDSSQEMLVRARAKANGDERIELRVGDATDLQLVDGRFDFVVSTWLLSHLDSPVEAVRGALSKLAPGGTAVFVFLSAPDPSRRNILHALVDVLGRPFSYRPVDPELIREIPSFERLFTCAAGVATLVCFRSRSNLPGGPNRSQREKGTRHG